LGWVEEMMGWVGNWVTKTGPTAMSDTSSS